MVLWKVTTPSLRTKKFRAPASREAAWLEAYKALGITWMPPGTKLTRIQLDCGIPGHHHLSSDAAARCEREQDFRRSK